MCVCLAVKPTASHVVHANTLKFEVRKSNPLDIFTAIYTQGLGKVINSMVVSEIGPWFVRALLN